MAECHDLALIAASTHPFASWGAQKHTDKERYNVLTRDLQGVARRLLVCGASEGGIAGAPMVAVFSS